MSCGGGSCPEYLTHTVFRVKRWSGVEWSGRVCLGLRYAMSSAWHSDKSLEIWASETGSGFSLLQSELLSSKQCTRFILRTHSRTHLSSENPTLVRIKKKKKFILKLLRLSYSVVMWGGKNPLIINYFPFKKCDKHFLFCLSIGQMYK